MDETKDGILPGTLEMLVLSALRAGALHGYAIARRLEQSSGGEILVEEGSLYPALHRMERKGWIEAEWGLSEANRRAKYYRMTPAGKKRLAQEAAQWERVSGAIARVLAAPKGA
jgi:transcriptional regulator